MRIGLVLLSFALGALGCGESGSAGSALDGDCTFAPERPDGIAPRQITAMALPSDGEQLVMGSPEGVARVSFASGQTETWSAENDGLAINTIEVLLADNEGGLWAGHGTALCGNTPSGRCGLSALEAGQTRWSVLTVDQNSDLLDDRIAALGQADDGTIWIGTGSGATFESAGRGYQPYFDWQDCLNPGDQCDPLFSFSVADVAFAPDGSTWLAIEQQSIGVSPKPGGVARRLPDGKTETWDRDQGLPSNRARAVAVTASGQIWAAGPFGAARLDGASWALELDRSAIDIAALGEEVWVVAEDGTAHRRGPDGQWSALDAALPGLACAVATGGDRACVGTDAGAVCYSAQTCNWTGH